MVAGGHCTFNPEPMADLVDAFVIGDGEEAVGDMTDVVGDWIRAGRPGGREGVLRELAGVPGVYVPSMYVVAYEGAAIASITPRYPDVPSVVDKRTVADLADWPYPRNQLVPLIEVVHDRLNVEVFRGCTRGCRFCQAGMITRPVRERSAAQVRTMVAEGLRRMGADIDEQPDGFHVRGRNRLHGGEVDAKHDHRLAMAFAVAALPAATPPVIVSGEFQARSASTNRPSASTARSTSGAVMS